MKRAFTLIFVLIISFTNGFAQQYGWKDISGNLPDFPYDSTVINNGEDTVIAGITGMCFISANEGWIATSHPFEDSAAILHTTNGGQTWEVQMAESSIAAIDMLSATEGFAASFDGNIHHTSNGGHNWEFHGSTFALSLSDMDFPPGNDTGYACGQNGAIFRITISGVEPMSTGFISDMKGICFVDANNGWVCGQGVMAKYEDDAWVAGHSYPSGHFTDVFYTDTENGWATGMFLSFPIDTVGIIHTSNDSSWFTQPLSIGKTGDMTKVFFLDNQKGWAVGSGGKIYSSVNGGQNWMREAEDMTQEWLNGVQFTSTTNGYVCGNKMTLLKYGPLSSIEEIQELDFKVFPNPLGDQSKINISGLQGKECMVEIIDLSGKVVMKMVECNLQSDNIGFDVSQLPSGLYIISATTNKGTISQKLIKID